MMYPQHYVDRLKAAAKIKPQALRIEVIDSITDELARLGLARKRTEDIWTPPTILRKRKEDIPHVPVFLNARKDEGPLPA